MSHENVLKITRIHQDTIMPMRSHDDDAGLDLCADRDYMMLPNERFLMPTGIAIALPPGTVGLVYPRSGLAFRDGVTLANSVGVIDAGYRGELRVPLHNIDSGSRDIMRGTRIAQLLVQPIIIPTIEIVDELDETVRGTAGFGSTGV